MVMTTTNATTTEYNERTIDIELIICGPQAACPRRSAVAGPGGIPSFLGSGNGGGGRAKTASKTLTTASKTLASKTLKNAYKLYT